MIAVLGVPFDRNSSFQRGAALAPVGIRAALHCDSSNLSTESGLDLGTAAGWHEVGDLRFPEEMPISAVFAEIETAVAGWLNQEEQVILLGGDHSISYPILRAYASHYPGLQVLQLDAHPDLYDELDNNRYSHACPFARVMEEGLVSRLVQAGIRTMTPHQRSQAQRFGVQVIQMREWDQWRAVEFTGPVYLSLDMDCLDPAFAPGVSHHEPGGLSTRQVLEIIQGCKACFVGADIVEYNPRRDVNGVTAMVAAKFLKEILAQMLNESV